MYLIAKGECEVRVEDDKKNKNSSEKVLRICEYFGEISMIYGCSRSASVISRKYSTLALLDRNNFKEITTEYPEMVGLLKEGIFKYNDRMKRFLTRTI